MKYLDPNMSAEEARKVYRQLAKTLHPDVGGDEEEFKILANEYAKILSTDSSVQVNLEDLTKAADTMVNTALSAVQEIYPRTRFTIWYNFARMELEFEGSTPFGKMLHIEELVNSFQYPLQLTCTFSVSGSKKNYTFYTVNNITYINMERGTVVPVDEYKPVYSGRRYIIKKAKQISKCEDLKTGHIFYMRNTPKFTLQELLGL